MNENNEIVRQELTAASFVDKFKAVSLGQSYILELLKRRIKDNTPVSEDDIVDIYFKTVSKDGKTVRIRYNLNYSPAFHSIDADKNHPEAKSRALVWFKQNLGACIIKGKLLVIPIIDINDQKQITQ